MNTEPTESQDLPLSDAFPRLIVWSAAGLILMFVGGLSWLAVTNRQVIDAKPAGEALWSESLDMDAHGVAATIDSKGQLQAQPILEGDTISVIGTRSTRWVVDGSTRFARGTSLSVESRKSGRRYLCGLIGDQRTCHRIAKESPVVESAVRP